MITGKSPSIAPIRIVRAKNTREWFVERDGGPYLCSLIETSPVYAKRKTHLLRSKLGNWRFEPAGDKETLIVTSDEDADVSATMQVLGMHELVLEGTRFIEAGEMAIGR